MGDYGHELLFGSFLTPAAGSPEAVVGLAQLSEELGLDLVTFSDHPYQPAFLDTWTLMSYVAAATVSVRIAPNVLNLPLRPPAVVARAAASLDRLSGGRFELGLGAGAYWDAIVAMGGERLTPGESVDALAAAVEVVRQIWDTTGRGGVRVPGRHPVAGAERGPAPAHDIAVWLGAYQPRMLRLTGRVANGWLPSSGYLAPEGLAAANAVIDGAATAAGRAPGDVRRLYNVTGTFTGRGDGFLQGPPAQWVAELSGLALGDGISAFILGSDDPADLTTFAREVVPAVREAVAAERAVPEPTPAPRPAVAVRQPDVAVAVPPSFPLAPTVDDGRRLAPQVWDETTRPSAPAPAAGQQYRARDLAGAQRLVDIHDHLRAELTQIRDLVAQVLDGSRPPALARSAINDMTVRQNSWTVGAYCAQYCRLVTTHHTLEDQAMFPQLRRADPALAPVVDRLHAEHEVIHEVLDGLDRALVAFVGADHDPAGLRLAVDQLTDALLSHLSYEERQLLEPLARLGLVV